MKLVLEEEEVNGVLMERMALMVKMALTVQLVKLDQEELEVLLGLVV